MSALRGQLRDLAVNALLAAGTLAGTNVFRWRDTATTPATMPNVAVRTPREAKEDETDGNGPPRFTTTTWLECRCQVDNTDAVKAEADLETLVDQVEDVILGIVVGPPQYVKRVSAVDYEMELSSQGARHFGEAILRFGFEYRESYSPTLTASLKTVAITVAPAASPALVLVTTGATAAGGAVLSFGTGNVPATVVPGLAVGDLTAGAIAIGTIVASVNLAAGTVTLNANVIAPGVALGDSIVFAGPIQAQADIIIPS